MSDLDHKETRLPFDSPASNASSSPPVSSSQAAHCADDRSRMMECLGQDRRFSPSRTPDLNVNTRMQPRQIAALRHVEHHRPIRDRRKHDAEVKDNGPRSALQRLNSTTSKLSPSDGTLVIGLSLDGASQAPPADKTSKSQVSPVTPEIIVTPAEDIHPELPGSRLTVPAANRRASSIYSQPTPLIRSTSGSGRFRRESDIPPVPPLPAGQRASRISPMLYSRASCDSIWTVDCNEEESTRRFSNESQQCMLRRNSLDGSISPRSSGWWNYLASPLFGRSDTLRSRRKSTKLSRRTASHGKAGMHDAACSPMPDIDTGLKPAASRDASETASTWSERRWEAERRTLAFFNDASPTQERALPDEHRGSMVLSPECVQTEGFGLAAEYFQACWHDQSSPTPFFQCQNHQCRQNRPLVLTSPRESAYKPSGTAGTQDRSLQNETPLPKATSAALSKTSASRGQAIERESFSPDGRRSTAFQSESDGTDIADDDELADEEASPKQRIERGIAPIGAKSGLPANPRDLLAHRDGLRPRAIQTLPTPSQNRELVSPAALTPNLSRGVADHSAIPLQNHHVRREFDQLTPIPGSRESPVESSDPNMMRSENAFEIRTPRAAPLPPPIGRDLQRQNALGLEHPDGLSSQQKLVGSDYPTAIYTSRNQSQSHDRNVHRPENTYFPPPPRSQYYDEKRHLGRGQSQEPAKQSRIASQFKCFLRTHDRAVGTPERKKRRRLCIFINVALFSTVLLIVLLVLLLTVHRVDMPVQTSWLNNTGFPPMPTGIATIAVPDVIDADDRCVRPATMWSCAVPREQQQGIAPNNPDQPNFRLEIRYRNGSSAGNNTVQRRSLPSFRLNLPKVLPLARRLFKRDAFTDALFVASPSPPSAEDQQFLGKTTDNNTAPYDGEATPFFMSFLPLSDDTALQLARRDTAQAAPDNSSHLFPNLTDAIPAPSINPDGTARAANLLPLPSGQPLRLFNRGKSDEHYGFYTYFDRSIFLHSRDLLNGTFNGVDAVDSPGGAPANAAGLRCTWTQMRFLVQIWTRGAGQISLLPALNNSTNSSSSDSADQFQRPGSFPYPVSVTLDRHGGDSTQKMIYCYAMDDQQRIIAQQRKIWLEDRGAGGTLVNPTTGVFGHLNVTKAEGGPGGVDGGTGGCRCSWRNFQPS